MRAWEYLGVAAVVAALGWWTMGESRADQTSGATTCAVFQLPVNRADGAEWKHLGELDGAVKGLAEVALPPGYHPIASPQADLRGGFVIACRE